MANIIIIPIYKTIPSDLEITSINQCFKILFKHKILFIHPSSLDLSFYQNEFKNASFKEFANDYFNNIKGYNKLMLAQNFYLQFIDFDYLLIYQTDCYVFNDKLDYWCSKSYDYIGGIWFDNFTDNPVNGAKEWLPGNGGFSLRKIKTFVDVLGSDSKVRNFGQLILEKKKLIKRKPLKFILEIFQLPFNMLGYKNKVKLFLENSVLNEDWLIVDLGINYDKFKIPKVEDSVYFSWDRCHKYMFEKYENYPFGVHAWNRNDFPYEGNLDFWKEKIL